MWDEMESKTVHVVEQFILKEGRLVTRGNERQVGPAITAEM